MELHAFGGYGEMYLEKLKADRVPTNTLNTYNWALKKHLNPYFKDKDIVIINQREVDAFRASKMNLSAATINLILQVLSGVLKLAMEYDVIDKIPTMRHLTPNMNEHYLTDEEALLLLSKCKSTLYIMVALALTTGLRRENIFHLKWSEISNGVLTVKAKRGKTISLPLSPQIIILLDKHRKFMEKNGAIDTEWVFPRETNHKVHKSQQADGGLKRAFRLAGLPYSGWHILRHTFATSFLRNNGNLVLLQNILGHSNVTQTSRYAHVSLDQKTLTMNDHANRFLITH